MTPRVSVVMAAKNYGRFLVEAVESVRRQTFPDWELLIIDDGSTDQTPKLVEKWRDEKRIRSIRSDKLGQARAKNLGIGLASAPLIAFLDADDAWLPTKLERQYALIRSRPEIGVVFSRRVLIDDQGSILPTPRPVLPRGRVLAEMLVRNFVCFSSVLIRREVFERVGWFSPSIDLAIDFDLWMRAAQFYEFDYVDEALVRYRTGHGNLSARLTDRVKIALSSMRQRLLREPLAVEPTAAEQAAAWASTYRSMAYAVRMWEPVRSVVWHAKAVRTQPRLKSNWRGLVGSLVRACTSMLRTPEPQHRLSENAPENV